MKIKKVLKYPYLEHFGDENTYNVVINWEEPMLHISSTKFLFNESKKLLYMFGGFYERKRVGYCFDTFNKKNAKALADWIYKHLEEMK